MGFSKFFELRGRVSARQPTYFLLQESRQRAHPYCPRPFGFACGQPAPSSSWGWLLHSAVQQPAPRACRRRRGHKGQYQMRVRDSFSMLLIAASLFIIWTRSQFRQKSRRPPVPASTRLAAPVARGSGCGQRCRRTALHRALTCRRLFERSGVPRSELGGTAA